MRRRLQAWGLPTRSLSLGLGHQGLGAVPGTRCGRGSQAQRRRVTGLYHVETVRVLAGCRGNTGKEPVSTGPA